MPVPREGPTTKADCLNALYEEMERSEQATGEPFRFVLLQDAEDQVHPAALDLIDDRLERADFVQLPVIPELHAGSRWVSGHYADEFAESHRKSLVVRDWLHTALPAAGVGCAFRRDMLCRIAKMRGARQPFAAECLTEDYELGLLVAELGGRSRFVRALDSDGRLIATCEFFPASLHAAIRQKSRWIHGIAFQGWERLGWRGGPADRWMRMRDRKGPLTALVLLAGYLALLCWAIAQLADAAGLLALEPLSPTLRAIVVVGMAGFASRAVVRVAFTTAQYSWFEGLCSIPRLPLANFIMILAARRALAAYLDSLRGRETLWEKTQHDHHPSSPPGLASAPRAEAA